MFLSILASIQSFPCPYTFVHHGEILREEIKIIGWLIFSRAAGATTKTAADASRAASRRAASISTNRSDRQTPAAATESAPRQSRQADPSR